MSKSDTETVQRSDDAKGFGFIERENAEDVFVHYRSIVKQEFRSLKQGSRVEPTLTQSA